MFIMASDSILVPWKSGCLVFFLSLSDPHFSLQTNNEWFQSQYNNSYQARAHHGTNPVILRINWFFIRNIRWRQFFTSTNSSFGHWQMIEWAVRKYPYITVCSQFHELCEIDNPNFELWLHQLSLPIPTE